MPDPSMPQSCSEPASSTHSSDQAALADLTQGAGGIISVPLAGPVPSPPPGHSWHSLMGLALDEARAAAQKGEVPVGAVLVGAEGTLLARCHNAPIAHNDPTAHAEVLALRQGGAHLGNYRLKGAVLVVTLEPCLMCTGALVHSRVAGVVYGAADARAGAIRSCCEGLNHSFLNHRVWHMGGIRSQECTHVLLEFFRQGNTQGKRP